MHQAQAASDLNYPQPEDLISQIQFDTEQGKIWLHEQRMLMTHASAIGAFKDELIKMMGVNRARGFLMRFGFHAGQLDARLAQRTRPNASITDSFLAGPQLHCIMGKVKVKPVVLDYDVAKGDFYAEFDWHGSYEAEWHLQQHGPSAEPVCWELLGYASGFSTFFMGRKILFKETSCAAQGEHDHCHIVGKPAEEWADCQQMEKLLMPASLNEELKSLRRQLSSLRASFRQSVGSDLLINSVGRSPAFIQVCQLISKASHSRVSVLLLGETGVGKEVVARGLHLHSDRAEEPFVAVNCACIPPDLIEAELFGVEQGAYTGAKQSRPGKFERAHQGTIFLDEVVELPPRAQASLLRALQEGEIERVGDHRTRNVDVRVVAATNENLHQAVKEGRFRADLYYRLNVYPVHIPPLRERSEDIPLLIQHFVDKYHTLYNKRTAGVSDKVSQALMQYKWPGNIRELENMIERGVILTDNHQKIEMTAIFPSLAEPSHPLNVIQPNGQLGKLDSAAETPQGTDWCEQLLDNGISLEQVEEQLIQRAMARSDDNVSEAARVLGISRATLAYRLKRLGSNK